METKETYNIALLGDFNFQHRLLEHTARPAFRDYGPNVAYPLSVLFPGEDEYIDAYSFEQLGIYALS